jgi:ABC-2 type transport system permease protein
MVSLFIGELRREFLLWWSYRANAISSVLMWGIIFPVLLVTIQNVALKHGVNFGPDQQMASVIGFLMWRLCMSVLAAAPELIESEAAVGTLESVVASSPISFPALFVFRLISRAIRSILETSLLAAVLILLFRLPFSLPPTAVLITLLTLAGAGGVGMALAGLALLHKSVASVTGIVANLALLISGALVPLNALGTIFKVLKFTFPTTWGIDILRNVLLFGSTLQELIANGTLLGLLFQSLFMVAAGLALFNLAFARTKVQGELSSY